jgi:hypothetical protein
MAGLYDMMFFVQLALVVGITLLKLYNIMTIGKYYDLKMGFITYILFIIGWFTGLIVFMLNPETHLYRVLFMLESLFLILNTLFLFIEILIGLKNTLDQPIGLYDPKNKQVINQ